ncbi:MAG TPA: glycogen/starch synthase [Lacibacter sp.]|nr:glycogen/starch synthase [Lacibacter sp.]HMO90044.1 glycogen/starch synthase [Lacibacter sp.]HMP86504.1 glycogen/starch synthase [Lacibacter sp.]
MTIVHVTAECYPVAKAGGLGDVAGALPKYLQQAGHDAKVIMPMYRTRFLEANEWEVVHKGYTNLGDYFFDYTVIRETSNKLGFELYLVDIYGLLDRDKIYGYDDDAQRFTAFQIAVVDWMSYWNYRPDVVHVHDHHTALIPFMMQHCYRYNSLRSIPTILTIHNAQYQGWMGWERSVFLPPYDAWKTGLLDWENTINPLACGIRCANRVTTVSHSYLDEMRSASNGLEPLFEYEKGKCSGILNGIDADVWNPAADTYLRNDYTIAAAAEGKAKNKQELCDVFGLDPAKPLFIFIGRLVGEKAADLLPAVIGDSFHHIGREMTFLVLGSGDPQVEGELNGLRSLSQGDYNCYIGYNEGLSHLMYAGADFLLMPSRVEPCGLNQLYAMRYGTVPVVRNTGGLRDTVLDMGAPGGYGLLFNDASVGDITHAIWRALGLYQDAERLQAARTTMMGLDYSWEKTVQQYIDLYTAVLS